MRTTLAVVVDMEKVIEEIAQSDSQVPGLDEKLGEGAIPLPASLIQCVRKHQPVESGS